MTLRGVGKICSLEDNQIRKGGACSGLKIKERKLIINSPVGQAVKNDSGRFVL